MARPAPVARPAAAPPRPALARPAPRAPAAISPRLARPDVRPTPNVTRAPATIAKPAATAQPAADATRQAAQERRQQLQQQLRRGNLSRADRRELRTLSRQERETAKTPSTQQPTAQTQQPVNTARQAAQERRQQLQQQLRQGNLSRSDRRELRALTQQERSLQNAERRLDRLQALQSGGTRLGRAQQRELQRLQSSPQLRERLQARQQQLAPTQQTRQLAPTQRAERRAARVTAQQAQAGRFAAPFRAQALAAGAGAGQDNRAMRRTLRLAARAAWQRGAYARYVPWLSAVYWPYAYTDVFHYTFWPQAYEPGYWAYVYDDFFDGVFFPDGAPHVEYAEGPYVGPYAAETTGSASPRGRETRREIPGRLPQEARQACAEPDKGVTAWPFDRIAAAVQPSAEQKALLEQMELAAGQAADRLKQACPENLAMTPSGRLQAMTLRLQGTLDAVKLVRPPLEKFYELLSDEQRARFNEIGPQVGRNEPRQTAQQGDCAGAKSGLSGLAIDRIEDLVQPTEAQLTALDRLSDALGKAVDTLQQACPTTIATTPVGRLETMQQRLEAMIAAANIVRPALDDFYASLGNEQKAKFNRLSRTAQAN